MAKPSLELIGILRATADVLENSVDYQWGHMGACNCGFLAQQVTRLSKGEIHRRAMMRYGDWTEQLNDYCPTSGRLFDDIVTDLINVGFDTDDLRHLETLSDPEVIRSARRSFSRNRKSDVIHYLRTWADLLESSLVVAKELPFIPEEAVSLPG